MQYVSSAGEDEGCIFCDVLKDESAEHVLHRGEETFVLLNAFPYNTGHLMVAPKRHIPELHDLSPSESARLMALTTTSVDLLREAMSPHGFNVGINLGSVAGAGIPGHLHVHVVPRWGGDTNYMAVVGATKVLPEMLHETAAKLRPLFAQLRADPG